MSLPPQPASPINLFYSYSHKDEKLRERLEEHLALMKRQGLFSGWHDRRITASSEWAGQIDDYLNSADLILLLVSPAFLASDYCYDLEMTRAVRRCEEGTARVIPVILRPCAWHTAPFGVFQALPRDGKPVTTWKNGDEAFLDIARGLREVINVVGSGARVPPRPPATGARATTTVTGPPAPPATGAPATTTVAAPSPMPVNGHAKLTSDELEDIVSAAEACDLLPNRTLLFRDLPVRLRNQLARADDPISQVRSDLHALNAMGHIKGVELPVLAVWLGAAETLADFRVEGEVFRRMRERIVGGGGG